MRSIIYSTTFDEQLIEYIEHGELTYGAAVATEKKDRVYDTIKDVLAHSPGIKQRDPVLDLVVYPVTGTPFFILYDYDDSELRVHFVFINGKPLSEIDPACVEW